jgi:hypothetical protein
MVSEMAAERETFKKPALSPLLLPFDGGPMSEVPHSDLVS